MPKILRESSLVVIEALGSWIIDGSNINDDITGIEFSGIARPDEICGLLRLLTSRGLGRWVQRTRVLVFRC
jgi:hypothetical protein